MTCCLSILVNRKSRIATDFRAWACLRFFVLAGVLSLFVGRAHADEALPSENVTSLVLGDFAVSGLEGWKVKSFEGKTRYSLMNIDGIQVLRATAKRSASGLFHEQKIDLTRTPVLHWRWRVDKGPRDLDETTKAGDDYAARIYLVKSGGILIWRTKALNYVWSSGTEPLKRWPNAFAGEAVQMLAVRTQLDRKGVWYEESRNVREDFKRFFGEDVTEIDAVALMTDADNSGQRSLAYYGQVYFTAE